MQYVCQISERERVGARFGVLGAVPVARVSFHGVLMGLVCLALIAALVAATVGAGVSGLGVRELVSGPSLPSAAGGVGQARGGAAGVGLVAPRGGVR